MKSDDVSAQAQSQSRRPIYLKRPPNWPWFALAALFFGYWLFMSSLERIDANAILAGIFMPELTAAQARVVPFNRALIWLVEMFHPRVLRHFIPLIAGWWLAVQAAISLMQVLYNCPDRKTAAEFLRRQRRDRVGGEEAYSVSASNLAADWEKSILLNIGGPVRVNIPDGYAAVTERNARFLRVLPAGTHDLGRFEHIYNLVNLQIQEKTAKDVSMLTKEGIPVRTDIALTFQLDHGEDTASHRRPYPYREDAVRIAAYAGVVGANGKVSSWADGPIGKVKGALAGMVSEEPLDNLIAAPSPRDAHHLMSQAVTRQVWAALPKDNIKPLQLRIGRLSPPPEVSRQYTEFWLANQRKKDMLARANGTAQLLQEAETARASAEIAMMQAIVEGVRHAQQEAGVRISGYLLTVRLLAALRQMFQSSVLDLQSVGGDTAELMSEIHSMDERLSDLSEQLQEPPPKFIPSRSE